MTHGRLIALTALLLSPFLFSGFAAAQSATPTPAGCTVAPRTDADIASLSATPAAAGTPEAMVGFPAGDPVGKTTMAALQTTLDQLRACGTAGDVNAVLALYTDAYVVNVALAPETVPIVEGTPAAPVARATPESPREQTLALIDAHAQAGGSIAGLVLDGSTLHVFVFVESAGLWRIDATARLATTEAGAPATPVQAAIADAATMLDVDSGALKLLYAGSRDWPDSALGCPQPGKFYAQVITPGYLVLIAGSGKVTEYHTDAIQRVVLCKTFGD